MGKVGIFVTGFVLGGAVVYGSLHYHIVRADDGLHPVPKISSTFSETYVDIRSFSFEDWNEHRHLAQALIQANKSDLMKGVATAALQDAVGGAVDGAFRAAGFPPPVHGQ